MTAHRACILLVVFMILVILAAFLLHSSAVGGDGLEADQSQDDWMTYLIAK